MVVGGGFQRLSAFLLCFSSPRDDTGLFKRFPSQPVQASPPPPAENTRTLVRSDPTTNHKETKKRGNATHRYGARLATRGTYPRTLTWFKCAVLFLRSQALHLNIQNCRGASIVLDHRRFQNGGPLYVPPGFPANSQQPKMPIERCRQTPDRRSNEEPPAAPPPAKKRRRGQCARRAAGRHRPSRSQNQRR